MTTQDVFLRIAEALAVGALLCRFIPETLGMAFAVTRSLHVSLSLRILCPLLLLILSGAASLASLILWYYKLTLPLRAQG